LQQKSLVQAENMVHGDSGIEMSIVGDLVIARSRMRSFKKVTSITPQAILSIHPNWASILHHLGKLSCKDRFWLVLVSGAGGGNAPKALFLT
jgi:hypothetical protein